MQETIGCLNLSTANDTMRQATKTPPPPPLYPHLIFQGECACLFADTNTGKSIYAVQIAEAIARRGNITIYYDFELSAAQFATRYRAADTVYKFAPSFYRVELSTAPSLNGIIRDIEDAAVLIEATVLVIDNLTYLCGNSDDPAAAAELMMQLKNLQKRHHWTILVVSHTPKRSETAPITINDLAGSRQLANFFDSIFAIGKTVHSHTQRYLKQIKVRAEEMVYHDSNVQLYDITKQDNFLQFLPIGTATESSLLKHDKTKK